MSAGTLYVTDTVITGSVSTNPSNSYTTYTSGLVGKLTGSSPYISLNNVSIQETNSNEMNCEIDPLSSY